MTMDRPFEGKTLVVTGGTGSLGRLLVRRLLSGEMGTAERIIVFSRDEAKQQEMRLEFQQLAVATDDVVFRDFDRRLHFWIGDVRDIGAVSSVLRDADVVFNAAALKQVPTAEYFPMEAVRTNIDGAHNIVTAIHHLDLDVDTVVGISTDKACEPVNVMGMTKAIQERVFVQGNLLSPRTRYVVVRYGNVLASRGSVIPLFHDQIRRGGPVTITHPEMTRFLLSLDDAVDAIFAAVRHAAPGETFVPRAPAARVTDLAAVLIGDRDIETTVVGVRPGEKLHETLVSAEEARRTSQRDAWLVVGPMLPELTSAAAAPALDDAYRSSDHLLSTDEVRGVIAKQRLTVEDVEAAP
jgi:UDP-glucose 4-epimerase